MEVALRTYQKILKMYQDNSVQARKLLLKSPATTESQMVLSQLSSIESIVRKFKSKPIQIDVNNNMNKNKTRREQTERKRKIIKPTPQELEKIVKSFSLPSIKLSTNINPNKKAEQKVIVSEFQGQFYQMTKYASGCSLLQKLLDGASKESVLLIFKEIEDSLEELITHPNGQYILPKIVEFGSEEIKDNVFGVVSENLVKYCCHQFGGYTVQKIAPFMRERHIQIWSPILRNNIAILIIDPHANYVIQTLLKIFNEKNSDFFYRGLKDCVVDISKTKIGCSVLTHAMDNSTIQQINSIKPQLLSNCCDLIQDQYGNFIIQHLMENDPTIISDIIHKIKDNIVFYSKQKFSSNVVEKCLKCSTENVRQPLLDVLSQPESLVALVEDQYGNFVIQAFLDVLPENRREEIAHQIIPLIPSNSQFSYHIEKKLLQSFTK
ncbi:pumilio domain-containing protein C6G9.14, putative [Entamoeba dispar SAW760]|uniref:Pumilio domain-containing protein C6G9.14, putative n=1 Tax=Entamoeba dispar (strain ATCC PRA-260 / SAW760) TaxID=370354 RepID=B0ERR8_ENTDS|nr:pumilio domain-containing protein C6G9.14, putative [Entamoeba dispar SAW760]EDR22713.1 pumilio domain-containing protein C6G9.14, putative [Entamoeba dispar SAW760]|eukprot:EDR22713.1 pumilio domain-containing protein C6G9.14, putative [Entamoeba dispar SAW760]